MAGTVIVRRRLFRRIEELVGVAAVRLSLLILLLGAAAMAEDDRTDERRQMVDDIVALSRLVGGGSGPGEIGARVLAAMGKVPRHEFVPVLQRRAAYRNRPLSIGSGQTISQPYIVALMTDLLDLKPSDTVLEIGTGCGYQSAVLAELAKDVYTIEIVEALGRTAAATLERVIHGQAAQLQQRQRRHGLRRR